MKVYAVRGACGEFVLESQLEEIGLVDVATGEYRPQPQGCPLCGGPLLWGGETIEGAVLVRRERTCVECGERLIEPPPEALRP